MGTPNADGGTIKLLVFFAANPDEELTTMDIYYKTGVIPNNQYGILRSYVEAGWLAKRDYPQSGKGGYKRVAYRAGPRMLEILGARVPL